MRGVRAHLDHLGVTRELALCHQAEAKPPDERVEPVHKARSVGCKIGPEVAADHVAEFVQENHPESLFVPEHAVGWKIHDRPEESGNRWGSAGGMEAHLHPATKSELALTFGQHILQFPVVRIEGQAAPAIQGRPISEQAYAETEKSACPDDREPRRRGNGGRAGRARDRRKFDRVLRQQGQGREG
jgi:hypothetical protein